MENLLLILHYILCTFLIVVILLQVGRGADLGAAFGGASQTVFGGRGAATFLNKLTGIIALGFLLTSLTLSYISRTRLSSSVMDNVSVPVQTQSQPEAGAPAEAAPQQQALTPTGK